MKKVLLSIVAIGAMTVAANAQLLFTQYYEGSSGTNKFFEIKNIGSTAIDLTSFTLSLYTNAAAENWKTGLASATNFTLTGSLAANTVLLIGNSTGSGGGTFIPSYITGSSFTAINSIANFNGNDSVVLWNNSAAFSTSQIVDALSFTNSGNEGVDKSFVRLNTDPGYNLTAGSNMTSFPSVWSLVTLADVASAGSTTDNYLGYSSVTAVPEPSTYAMLFAGAGVMFWMLRRKKA